MAAESETLNIGSLQPGLKPPASQPDPTPKLHHDDPIIHPVAAAAARARIQAIKPELNPILHPDAIPAAPTADLITDKAALKTQLEQLSTVSRPQIPSALRPILTAIGIFALVLLLFKAPVILSQVGYSMGQKPSPTTSVAPASQVVPAENTISIPKINVQAPVIYEPSVKEADVQKALEGGVVHYGNTAVPGQNGNAAIFGHSSNDWWEPGNYKFVFVLLDKLVVGDRFTIDYQSRRYTYEVTGSKVVEPTDLSVLKPTTEPTVTLITCTPPGTSLRRLVITAKQVDPAPAVTAATTKPKEETKTDKNLPSSPSFFTQLQKGWDGVVHGFKSLFGADGSKTPESTPTGGQLPTAK